MDQNNQPLRRQVLTTKRTIKNDYQQPGIDTYTIKIREESQLDSEEDFSYQQVYKVHSGKQSTINQSPRKQSDGSSSLYNEEDYQTFGVSQKKVHESPFQNQKLSTINNINAGYLEKLEQEQIKERVQQNLKDINSFDISEVFINGKSQRHMGQGKFHMTWKMVQSNGFKQQQQFRKRGKQILEDIVNEKKERIGDVLEEQIKEALEDSSVQDPKKQAQNVESFSTTLYLQKVVQEVGNKLPTIENGISVTRNERQSRFKSVDLPELSLNSNLKSHNKAALNLRGNKYNNNNNQEIDDYSNIDSQRKINYLPSVLNKIKPKSTRNHSQLTLANKRGSSHTLVSARNYQSKLKLDKSRDNQNFEHSFVQNFKVVDPHERALKVKERLEIERVKREQNEKQAKEQEQLHKLGKKEVLFQDVYKGNDDYSDGGEDDYDGDDWDAKLQDELLDQVDQSILNKKPKYDKKQNELFSAIIKAEELKKEQQQMQNNQLPSDLTIGLKTHKIPKLTGGVLDKQKLNISKFDMKAAFNEDNMKKVNFNGDDENLEKQIYSDMMKDNEYFKKFAQKHQRKLEMQIENVYGRNSPDEKLKQIIPSDFKQQFLGFLNSHNQYRRENINIFETKIEINKDFIKDKLRFLTPIKLPSQRKNETVFEREEDLRRLKAANYGKWYLKPDDYNKKIDKLNKKLNTYIGTNNY